MFRCSMLPLRLGCEFQAIHLNEFTSSFVHLCMKAEPVRLQKTYNYNVYSNSKNPFKSFLQVKLFQKATLCFYLVSDPLT